MLPVMDLYQTVQHIADHASPAKVSTIPTPGISLARVRHHAFFLARQRGTIDGYRRSLFGLSPDSQ